MKFAERLRARDNVLGMLNYSGSAAMVELMGVAGFDFVLFDTEHTTYGLEHAAMLIPAAKSSGIVPLTRVYQLNEALITQALDSGSEGVVIPHVNSADEARRAVRAAWFPPYGNRGMCPDVRAAHYDITAWLEYAKGVQSEISIIPLIEEGTAVDNIDDIVSVEGINAVIFGPADYATSTLEAAKTGFTDEVWAGIRKALKRVCEAAEKKKVSVITTPLIGMTDPERTIKDLLDVGVTGILYATETTVFHEISRNIAETFKSLVKGNP